MIWLSATILGVLAFKTSVLLYSLSTDYFAVVLSLHPILCSVWADGALTWQPKPEHVRARLILFYIKLNWTASVLLPILFIRIISSVSDNSFISIDCLFEAKLCKNNLVSCSLDHCTNDMRRAYKWGYPQLQLMNENVVEDDGGSNCERSSLNATLPINQTFDIDEDNFILRSSFLDNHSWII